MKDFNSVQLLGYYGSDEVIACSAWTSTSRELTEDKRNRIPELIDNLWSNGHETPFEKGLVHFLVNSEIASHIHKLKHRLSSANAESARYKELQEDKSYIPVDWFTAPISQEAAIKLMKLGYTPERDRLTWSAVLEDFSDLSNAIYHIAVDDLEESLGRKRAKESARYFKMYNSQIQCDISFNMRSFANFIKLRNSEHAQKEIKDIAYKMLELVEGIGVFENTLNVWRKCGMIDPTIESDGSCYTKATYTP